MNRLCPTTVHTTLTDSRSQRRTRSFLTSDRVAARTQPRMSASDVVGGGPSRALPACATATEV
jgi:hypothetical protein